VSASSIEIRAARPDDEKGVLCLYEEAFGEPSTPQRWRWLFEANPYGRPHVVVACAGARCVGHYALCPAPLTDGTREFLGWMAMDHMVSPDYQGQRIYQRMEAMATETIPDRRLSYSFVNENSFPVFIHKFGWSSLGNVPVYVRPGSLAGLRQRVPVTSVLYPFAGVLDRILGRPGREFTVRPFDRFGTAFDQLWQECRGSLGVTVSRDAKFLNWRFVDGPEEYQRFGLFRDEELQGYVVLKVERKFRFTIAWLMDVVMRPGGGPAAVAEALRIAVAKAWSLCDFLGVLLPNPALKASVRAAGFWRLPVRLQPHKFWFIVKREEYPDDSVKALAGWYLTWGVNDVP
jgi:predicted N-acetyltransferase YhbS